METVGGGTVLVVVVVDLFATARDVILLIELAVLQLVCCIVARLWSVLCRVT